MIFAIQSSEFKNSLNFVSTFKKLQKKTNIFNFSPKNIFLSIKNIFFEFEIRYILMDLS